MQTMNHVDIATETVPLVVDLDGTLLKTDSLWESVILFAKTRWYALALLPLWILRGKAYFKWRVAQLVELPVANLPYNESFVAFLDEERQKPRQIILATAANEKIARAVATHLGLFDHVLASNKDINLSGANKLARIQSLLNGRPFDYAGNEKVDLAIWQLARRAVLVNPTNEASRRAQRIVDIEKVFEDGCDAYAYLRAIRIYQWPKNLLIFLPIITAHLVTEWTAVLNAMSAFLSWSLCASSVYVLNDIVDLDNDRQHPKKRHRPFASGAISLTQGFALIVLLLLSGFALSLLLSQQFTMLLGAYWVIAVIYSLYLKEVMLLDVTTIAGLYTLRVVGGAEAVNVVPTFWLLAFSMFLFLHLALVKRYADLLVLESHGKLSADGRDYRVSDLQTLLSLGASAGYLAVLVLALYINSSDVKLLYGHPKALWLLCPLLLYWTGRMWAKAVRSEMHYDPLIYALTDRTSWLVVAVSLAVVAIAV